MKRLTKVFAISIFTLATMLAPALCSAQTFVKGVTIITSEVETSPSKIQAANELEIELKELNAEINYLEYRLQLYNKYNITGSARDGLKLDLQDAYQKQARLFASLSNIQKVLSDTSNAVIRNAK